MNADRHFATLQDFIVGRLSDDERRAFEDRLIRDPELVRELEHSLRMSAGLQQLRTQGYFRKAASRAAHPRIWVPALVAAAGAGLALFLWLPHLTGSEAILVPSVESLAATNAPPAVAAHFTFVSVRGGSTADLDLPSAGLIELRVAPTTSQTVHHYRVTLVRAREGGSAEPIAALGGLALSGDGYVHCYAEAPRLGPGHYVLRIQPDTDAQDVADVFRFNLRATVSGASR